MLSRPSYNAAKVAERLKIFLMHTPDMLIIRFETCVGA